MTRNVSCLSRSIVTVVTKLATVSLHLKNAERIDAIKQMCTELGLDFQAIGPGQYVVAYVQPGAGGNQHGYPAVRREFRGLQLEFASFRYSVAIERERRRVKVRSGPSELFSFDISDHHRYTTSPVAGDNGLLLAVTGMTTKHSLVPIGFLSDTGNLFASVDGAQMMFGDEPQAIAELFFVRNRADRVSHVVANDRTSWGIDGRTAHQQPASFRNLEGERVNAYIEAQRILREHGQLLIELGMLRP